MQTFTIIKQDSSSSEGLFLHSSGVRDSEQVVISDVNGFFSPSSGIEHESG